MIGQGHAGLPLAVRAAEAGYLVVGVDIDAQRVERLLAGRSYIEDVTDARLAAVLGCGRYSAGADMAEAADFDICVITVPAPLRGGAPDPSAVADAAYAVAPYLRPGATVILESPAYPGTTDELLRELLEEGSGLRAPGDFHLGYSPERIDPGNPCWRLETIPKIVSGLDDAALARVDRFYSTLVERTVPVSTTRVAELAKLLEVTFRHVNIALVNEMAMLGPELGVDVREAIEAAATKPFGHMRFTPGPGVGGERPGVEPLWPPHRGAGRGSRLTELADAINAHMPEHVVGRITRGLNHRRLPLRGSRVLVLGLAYKRNSGHLRESAALRVAAELHALGAHVRAVDPHVDQERVPDYIDLVRLTQEEVAGADAVAVLTDHDCFDYTMVGQHAAYVFDAHDRCQGHNVERL
ncbi:nucleotide sugar dehydrogenase [Thermocatellispora tengchongensis]